MKKNLVFIFIFSFIFLLSSSTFAGNIKDKTDLLREEITEGVTSTGKEPITVNGDVVEYFQEKGEVVASKNVEIFYKDLELTCDSVRLNVNTKDVLAEGNVKLRQNNNTFSGELVSYNFETKKGTILNGDVKAPPWYGKAQKIDKLTDNQYNLTRSYVTTCDLEKPHYRLQAKRVKIFPGDRVEAYHILMFIGKYPIMYLPYYNHSLKDNMMHVTITPGKNKEWGYFVLTRWRYYINENSKGNIFLDYREKKGIGEGVDYSFNAGKLGTGYARIYYTNEDDKEKTVDRRSDRYLFQYRHRVNIAKDTVGYGEFHKMSDADFLKDYFFREQYERDDRPPSYVSVIQTKPWYVLSFYAQKRINDFFTEVERLPEIKLDIKETQIGKTNLYYKGDFVFSNLAKRFANKSDPDMDAVRIDTFNKGSYVMKFFKFLNVTPFVDTRQTFYSRNLYDRKNLIRSIYDFGVDTNTRLYRIYDVKTNFFNLDINRLRHIITPSIGYRYTPPPTIGPENLQQFDEIDTFTRQNTLTLSLENKLQTKRYRNIKVGTGKDSKIEKANETVDLVRAIISTNYLFKPKNDSGSRFDDFLALLELRPYNWLFVKMDADFSHTIPKDDKRIAAFKTVNLDVTASNGELWSIGLQHRYERKASSRLGTVITYKLTPKWKIRALQTYDFKQGEFYDRELTLTRDLHCWEVDFTTAIRNKSEMIFYLIFRIKAFPETPLELKTTYSRSRPGAQDSLPSWMRTNY